MVLSLQRLNSDSEDSLLKLDGQPILKSKALPIVDSFIREGLWAKYESSLSPRGRRALYSQPGNATCSRTRSSSAHSFFSSQDSQCSLSVQNDGEIDAVSKSLWIQRRGVIYGFHIWVDDPAYLAYFGGLPDLTASTLRSLSAPRTVAATRPFSIQLSSQFGAAQETLLAAGSTLYTYQPNGDDRRVFAVEVIPQTAPAENLAATAEDLFRSTLAGFSARVNEASIESENQTVNNLPGLMHTAVVERNHRREAAFHTTLFDHNRTFVIFSFADVRNLKQAARDFVQMTRSFRQQ